MSGNTKGGEVRVHVASILFEYTEGESILSARGKTILAVLMDLDRRHPGLLFRIVDEQEELRPHIKIFVGGKLVRNLDQPLGPGVEIHILQALSGG